jgi:peptide chain release factor 1
MIEKLEKLSEKYSELTRLLGDPKVLENHALYQKYAKSHADLQEIMDAYGRYKNILTQLAGARDMLGEAGDDREMKELAQEEIRVLEEKREAEESGLKLLLLPRDPNDEKNVILEIRAGTGGDEASLFAGEIFRMYCRFAESLGWKIKIMHTNQTGVGGIKEVIASVEGPKAYSRLKYESGGHRVQRVPVTETGGRIHTSAVTVAVLPEAEDVEVDIDEKDLRIDRFCSSGPGGQSVNTTYSAIRITHIPTGIVVSCQDEKSQHKNKASALRVLRSRLYNIKLKEQQDSRAEDRRSQVGSGDRSEKIRTYNYPQGRITDHRINFTTYRLNEVLDGDLAEIIDACTTYFQAENMQKELEI